MVLLLSTFLGMDDFMLHSLVHLGLFNVHCSLGQKILLGLIATVYVFSFLLFRTSKCEVAIMVPIII